ncbi:MAG: Holliday junction resolvase RuvX [Gammaproteobacteria bacterium CG11_big_fil_rev_8_21_14_0_20_46_22]|nr:MAG: Holliday junction resolvase RuvX [Gammaproteobacteria bacterium CG12_big_fil_rev_8_21_14_0_65_46_12]PIR10976.1 MAG: Holliday junction resolvase RuvX [Gammaproteobacteria bacterium CG11_big_fil_rev_8_21_14_0_20_46_22]
MENITRLLGFDFGLKRIGVAFGQTITCSAKPLCTLKADSGLCDARAIANLVSEWRPQALIVGLPLNMDDTEQAITQKARKFSTFLQNETGLPVHLFDERLTTIEAREQIFRRGGCKALEQTQIDAVAAALILEGWMQYRR